MRLVILMAIGGEQMIKVSEHVLSFQRKLESKDPA
jgi:hypothetical protein